MATKMTRPAAEVKKHPETIAWDEYESSHEKDFDSTTLGVPRTHNQYLKNRIYYAFKAGIKYGERKQKGQP